MLLEGEEIATLPHGYDGRTETRKYASQLLMLTSGEITILTSNFLIEDLPSMIRTSRVHRTR